MLSPMRSATAAVKRYPQRSPEGLSSHYTRGSAKWTFLVGVGGKTSVNQLVQTWAAPT
jgi:hypothetical protein